jgi:T5SS/PEP-CTERM-associated repeat protein/autotransporter-associated beta strand protein
MSSNVYRPLGIRVSTFVRFATLVVAFHLLGRSALGQTRWTDGTGSWFDGPNWTAGVPTAAVVAEVNNGGTAQVVADAAQAFSLTLGNSVGESGKLSVVSLGGIPGSLTVVEFVVVGSVGNGEMTISGRGSVTDDLGVIGASGVGTVMVNGANASWTNREQLTLTRGTLSITNGGKVSDVSGIISTFTSGSAAATVSGAGSTWTNTGTLEIGGTGSNALTITDGGLVTVAGQATIRPGGLVNFGSGGVAGTLQAPGVANDGTLSFNHTGAVTFSNPLAGTGRVVKQGAGTTTITGAQNYSGAFEVNAGQLILKNSLRSGLFAVNGGTLRFDAATVNLPASGAIRSNGPAGVVEYNNATVNGGFLRGPGIHSLLAGGANTFNGVTTFNNTVILQNGTANFNNFTNGGTLTSNAALNFDGAVNASSGAITVNSNLLSRDFTNNGVFTINNGGVLDSAFSNLVSGGGSRTTINPGGVVFLSDGTAWNLNGALLVNNGQINGAVNVYYGSLAKGNGSYGTVNVFDGGSFAPGMSPGSISVAGDISFGAGATLEIELGGLLPGAQYDQVHAGGRAQLGGTLNISLLNGFVPPIGSSFEILTYLSHAGDFSDVLGAYLGQGRFLDPLLDADRLTLVSTQASAGDTDLDGDVDLSDLGNLATNFGLSNANIDWINGDFDSDNDVDLNDLGTLATYFNGGRAQAYAEFQALVPEPNGLTLAGLMALILKRRRQTQEILPCRVPPAAVFSSNPPPSDLA